MPIVEDFPAMAAVTRTVLGQLRREALVTTKPMQCLSRQYMSTAAHADAREPSGKIREDAVTQALRILQTAPIAWNSSGSAAFDFRSEYFLPSRMPLKLSLTPRRRRSHKADAVHARGYNPMLSR
jgi:hypothetical protein